MLLNLILSQSLCPLHLPPSYLCLRQIHLEIPEHPLSMLWIQVPTKSCARGRWRWAVWSIWGALQIKEVFWRGSCVALDKLCHLSEPQCPYLQNGGRGWGGNSTAYARLQWELNEQMHFKCLAQGLASGRYATNNNHHHHYQSFYHTVRVPCKPQGYIQMWSSTTTILHVSSSPSALIREVTVDLTCPVPKPVFSGMDWTPFGFFEHSAFIWPNMTFLRAELKASSRTFLQKVLSAFAWVGTKVS